MTPKPEPPDDLWERMDAINQELDIAIVTRGFSVEEYAERYGCSRSSAECRIKRLLQSKRIERIGKKASKTGRIVAAYDLVGCHK